MKFVLDEHRHDWETDLAAILRLLDEHPDTEIEVLISRPIELGSARLDGQGRLTVAAC